MKDECRINLSRLRFLRATMLASACLPGVASAQTATTPADAASSSAAQSSITAAPPQTPSTEPTGTAAPQVTTGVAAPETTDATSPFGDIIVTAQKRQQSTQDIGITISAFNDRQLTALGVTDVKGVASLVPGFTVAQSDRGPPIYTIRGVGFDTPNPTSSSPVGIYYDEVSYPYPAEAAGPSFDIERIEVLKGPQGTLYGRNTTGGLVNNIAAKPSADVNGYFKVGAGNYGSFSAEGAFNTPLTSTLNARISFIDQQSTRGWQYNIVNGERLGKVNKQGFRLQLAWEPTSNLKFLLEGNYWRDRGDTQVGQAIEVYPKVTNAAVTPANAAATAATLNALGLPGNLIVTQAFTPTKAGQAKWYNTPFSFQGTMGGNNYIQTPVDNLRKNNNLYASALRSEWSFAPHAKLTLLTAYQHYNQQQGVDISGWSIPDAISIDRSRISSFSQEVRLSGDTSKLTYIVGLFYARDKTSENNSNFSPTGTNIGPLRTLAAQTVAAQGGTPAQIQDVQYGFTSYGDSISQKVTTKSAFGQAEYKLNSKLGITLGLRYTQDRARFTGCTKDSGDNSIASVWNVFFRAIGIPSNVPPGGCVTYVGDLAGAVSSGGAIPFPSQGFANLNLDQNNLAGRFGLDFHIDKRNLLYASYTRGFKSGAFPNIDANVSTQYEAASQERVDALEAGFKTEPALGLTLNGAAFYYFYKDKQVFGAVPDIIFTTLNRIVNIPKSHLYGVEGEASYTISHGLTAHVTGTYIKTEIDQYTGFDQFGNPQDFMGDSFAFTPKVQVNGILTYAFDVLSDYVIRLTGNVRYSSSQQGDLIGDRAFAIIPYTLADANVNIGTRNGKYELSLLVKNVTNRYYWNSVQNLQDSVVRYAGMPRTYGATFQVYF